MDKYSNSDVSFLTSNSLITELNISSNKNYYNDNFEVIDFDSNLTVDNSDTRDKVFSIEPHSINLFSNFSDYNNITNEGHFIMQYLYNHTEEFSDKKYYPDGTTHLNIGLSYEEMLSKLDDGADFKISKFFDTINISDSGNGCFTVDEYIYDNNSGLDALLLKDCGGNYRLCYGSTDQFADKITDFFIVADSYSPAYNLKKFIHKMFTNEELMTRQEIQARTVAKYCFEKAKTNNKKLSLCGYSLGGALCENATDSLMANSEFSNVVDGVILINPLHADLSKQQIEKLKNTKNFNLYVNGQDPIHKITKYEEYKDVQRIYSHNNDIKESPHNLGFFSNDDYIKYAFNSDGTIKKR